MITYFIQSGDFVKIGRSKNVNARLKALGYGLPLVPTLIKTSAISERNAHKIAGTLTKRTNGEWFQLNDELMDWIKSIDDQMLEFEDAKTSGSVIVMKISKELNDILNSASSRIGISKSQLVRMALPIGISSLLDRINPQTTNTGAEA